MNQLKRQDLVREHCYIDGKWEPGAERNASIIRNPATQEILAKVASCTAVDVNRAVLGAQRAFPAWSAKTGKERGQILRRWFDLIVVHKEDLGRILTLEQGKPLPEAIAEIQYAASFIEWFAEEAKRVDGDVLASPASDKRLFVIRQPIGVAAAITPWNFPAAMITRKAGPALASGCTMVVKPAEQTPLTALALAVLAEEAGVPPGVLSFVTGKGSVIGPELTKNPIVRKVSFTGSTPVGKRLMRECSDTVKKLSLELGGNAPFIVFEDADMDKAVIAAVQSKFRNAGQTCVCTNRFYVQSSVYEVFVKRLSAAVAELRVGNGLEAGTQIGPLIDTNAVAKVKLHLDDALSKGGKITIGGNPDRAGPHFFKPTVIRDASADMLLAKDETFGPLAPIFRFDTEDEAVEAANSTEFGLASYLFTQDISRAWRVAEAIESGMVGINTGLISNEVGPFGGVKESGLGREGSKYGIDEYLESKYLCLGS